MRCRLRQCFTASSLWFAAAVGPTNRPALAQAVTLASATDSHVDAIVRKQAGPGTSGAAEAVVGGLLGGAIGLIAGGYLGYRIDCPRDCYDFDGLPGLVFGAFLGEAILMGIGAHVGHGFRGSVGTDIGASFAGAMGTLALARMGNTAHLLWVGAAGQLALTVFTELRTAKNNANARRYRLSLHPTTNGVGAGVSVSF